jgi:sulfate/thiosulfate transport system ATP-binding protein
MAIVLEHVNKSYGNAPIVRDFSVEIESGELFVLLGASGSGKSTILRLIAGLTEVDSGKILLNGSDVTYVSPQKRGTGFVFQNYSLFRHMTVAQNIDFGLSIRRKSHDERRKRVAELLDLIGLAELGDRLPSQLSGGQQQRVALARALAYEPSVLLLDEPFGALDVKIRTQLRQNLRDIQKQLGVTAILVTHDQDEAFELADRIGIIEHGQLLEVGTSDTLYRRPQTRFAATFLGVANLLPGQRNGTCVHVGEYSLQAPPNSEHLTGKPVDILIRPEEIELALQPEQLRGQLIGRGIVQQVGFGAPLERVSLDLVQNGIGSTLLHAFLHPSDSRVLNIARGQEVWVGVKDYHLLSTANQVEQAAAV